MGNNIKSVVVLHNIRSVYNVGAIFRTADAVGVSKIYLTGYTPTPLDRFRRERKDVAKAALGAQKSVQWEYFKNINTIIKELKKENFGITAVEQSKNSVDYKTFNLKQKIAFIFGNEVRGISKQLLEKCDKIIEIPMRGKKESLNVSVSAGVVLFRVLDK
ncbi:MAG TPA: TrmH family RNA methyltransferase [Candidatus Yonathbacteria bacterium]|nr:TrmH family RNA methyltransferase [Candidatus Yonathbacteria bacterium]